MSSDGIDHKDGQRGERSVPCSELSTSYKCLSCLLRNKNVHSEDRQFQSNNCVKAQTSPSNLVFHT